jgi:hypothetical protein
MPASESTPTVLGAGFSFAAENIGRVGCLPFENGAKGKEAMSQEHKNAVRKSFPSKFARQVQSQFTQFTRTDMTAYTFERTKSEFKSAKTDLSVFNTDGKLVLLGREFGNRIFFWQPLPVGAI